MKEMHKKILELTLPYQDKRNDLGHAQIVIDYGVKLCRLEKADDNVVIPADILHDVGWSQVPKEEIQIIFDFRRERFSREQERVVRKKHEKQGRILGERILNQVKYDINLIPEILNIIDGHDTRNGFFNRNDGVARDADILWRFSKVGFWADVRNGNFSMKELYEHRKNNIDRQDYFYSESAKRIARKEIEKRGGEVRENL